MFADRKKSIILILSILIFITTWFLLNDSYNIGRDELYYASYSLFWDEDDTDDIRYITEKELYKIAMLPTYRIILNASLSIFGENILGLRLQNLVSGILILCAGFWLGNRLKLSTFWVLLFTIALLADPKMGIYFHLARPDFILMTLTVWVFVLLVSFMETGKKYLLFIAGVLSGVSWGIYWNGIALSVAFFVVVVYFLWKKSINFKMLLAVSGIMTLFVLIFFVLPIARDWDVFIALFSSEGFQTAGIAEGTAILNQPIAFVKLLWFGFTNGILIIHGAFFAITLALTIYLVRRRGGSHSARLIQSFSIINLIFILVFLFITAFRGHGEGRYVDYIMPLIILQFSIVALEFLYSVKTKRMKKISVCCLSLFLIIIFGKVVYDGWNNRGQTAAYNQYSNDLQTIIVEKDERVLTVYDCMWALPNPKLYVEVIMHKTLETYEEVSSLFEMYDVEYALLDERSKDRIADNESFYIQWAKVLNDQYSLLGRVENKYYRPNKGKPPANNKEFVTEVWRKKGPETGIH